MKKKIAILGASYLQKPLVEKAKSMGLESHVFAWKDGNVVEHICDHYYDISILDKNLILKLCKEIKIDAVTSIASDIAMPSVNFIANELNLTANSMRSTLLSTDKFEMRSALRKSAINCPNYGFYSNSHFKDFNNYKFPLIVKPTDRSGSLGVTKVSDIKNINKAIDKAISNSISGKAIVEEFIDGREFSVEGISVDGNHRILAITDKTTTGSPYFVEIEHQQPAEINASVKKDIECFVIKALNALEIKNGASHTELFLSKDSKLYISEVAGRMGGDWIGSHITPATTGFDYLKAVILIALGETDLSSCYGQKKFDFSGVRFITPKPGKIKAIFRAKNFDKKISDHYFLKVQGDDIDNILDSSGKRTAILFYSGNKRLFGKDLDRLIEYKIH